MWFLTSVLFTGKVIVDRDVPYAEDGSRFHSLDIYAPERCEKCPVMVFIHGGAWRTGDKGNHGKKGLFFAQKGFVFVSVNYRTFPRARFPLFVEDVSDAVAWIHENIHKYGGDGNRIILMGHSAGAHIAALVSYEKDFLRRRGMPPDIIRGSILLDGGAYDLISLRDSFPLLFEKTIRPVFGKGDEELRRASPVYRIERGFNPPTLIVHTERPASASQARILMERLKETNSKAVIYCACGMSHRQVNTDIGEDNQLTETLLEFVRDALHMENRSPR